MWCSVEPFQYHYSFHRNVTIESIFNSRVGKHLSRTLDIDLGRFGPSVAVKLMQVLVVMGGHLAQAKPVG